MPWSRDNRRVVISGEGYFCLRPAQVFWDGWVSCCCQKDLSGDLLLLPIGGPAFLYHVDPSVSLWVLVFFIWRPWPLLDGGDLYCWQWRGLRSVVGDWPDCDARERLYCCGRGAVFLLG